MKLPALAIASLFFAVTANPVDLNALLDDRIDLNRRYKKELVESAAGADNAQLLAKCEADVADSWLELLAYAKSHKDDRLKAIVLELEYHDELRSFGYDKEYAENPEESRAADRGAEEYRAKLEAIANDG